MYDSEVLKIFARQPVSQEMVAFLVSTTNSIIQVKTLPPTSPIPGSSSNIVVTPKKCVSLTTFINNLIKYSNVQTPTLMASLIYLNKLRNLLPANAVGMETTRHRIFLASLILSAKTLNDSLPLNKHWTKYTDGLLSLQDVNMAERELIGLLKWNINVNQEDLLIVLQPFLTSIKYSLAKKREEDSLKRADYYRLSNALSNKYRLSSSLSTSYSNASIASSKMSLKSAASSSYSLATQADEVSDSKAYTYRPPLSSRSLSTMNRPSPSMDRKDNYQNHSQHQHTHNHNRVLV